MIFKHRTKHYLHLTSAEATLALRTLLRFRNTHHGYYHYKYDAKNGVKKLATNLTPEEKQMIDRVRKLWYNHKHKR